MKTRRILSFTVMLFIAVVSVSCKEEVVIPGTPEPIVIAPPTDPNPSNPQLPVGTGDKVKKITWSALDFKTFHYNDAGKLVKLYSQYNNVQGTNQVQRFQYEFTYNAAGEVIETKDITGAIYVYTYENGRWKEAIAYNTSFQPICKYVFVYNEVGKLIQSNSYFPGENWQDKPIARVNMSYDAVGNLIHYKREWYNQNSQSFTSGEEIVFSEFDTQKYVPYTDTFSDELMPVNFWVNNPGKKEFVNSDSPVHHYSYTYNDKGFPLSRTTSYTHYKPLPQLLAEYTY